MKISEQSEDSLPHSVIREVDILQALQGTTGVIDLLHIFRAPSLHSSTPVIKLVFPYFKDGDLQAYMKSEPYKNKRRLPIDVALDFTE